MILMTPHPKDPGFALLKVSPDHNAVIGTFGPAERADHLGMGVYAVHRSALEALHRWAAFQSIQLLDETDRGQGEPRHPVQCGNVVEVIDAHHGPVDVQCCAPYSVNRLPRYCGACGQPAKPVIFHDEEPALGVRCEACRALVRGGARFCPGCGALMPDSRALHRPAVQPPASRPHLSDPEPLGAVMAGTPLAGQVAAHAPAALEEATPEPVIEQVACTVCFRPVDSDAVDAAGRCARCEDHVEPPAETLGGDEPAGTYNAPDDASEPLWAAAGSVAAFVAGLVHPAARPVRTADPVADFHRARRFGSGDVDHERVRQAMTRFRPGQRLAWGLR